jgi:glutamate/tyrosine decarboxylase-like PLP-dependent enzyme
VLERALALLQEHLDREQTEPVAPYRSPGELRERIDLGLPRRGVDDEQLFGLLRQVVEATPRTTTRRFFNQLFSGRDAYGSAAELLAAFLNTSMYTFKAAGPHVLIERELTAHMAAAIGYTDGEGVFAPGGSMSNLTGMLLARNAKRPEARDQGLGGRTLTFYASRLCHYSVPKMAAVLGVGRRWLRRIETDDRGRMMPGALREAVQKDVEAGDEPFLVVATSGTTVLGAFDPLDPIADVAEEFGMWLHVDGALGGSMSLSPAHRHLLEGSGRSHSFTWNAHKLLGVPLNCSVLLTREPGRLRASLEESASYLFQAGDEESEYDLGSMSLQCGRRNDALKLWAAWKHHGDEGFGRRVEHLAELARYAAARVQREPDLVLSRTPESINVCFEVKDRPSDLICERLRREARGLVGHGVVDGRRVIRLAAVNAALRPEDLDAFFDHVLEVAREASAGSNAVA